MESWKSIEKALSKTLNRPFNLCSQTPLGGGCINSAYRISDGSESYFVKVNRADHGDMFAAEADGLEELSRSNTIRIPKPVAHGIDGGYSWLVMELIPFGGSGDMARFGEQLAQMHQHTADQYGWFRDNTIGSTPQHNDYCNDWITFLRRHRYGYQLDLAERNGGTRRLIDNGRLLVEKLDHFFSGYSPAPSLLHGDLWSGNYAFSSEGEAVIYDPAVYYGDREADMAMTELFGAFGSQFYRGYESVWPLDQGYRVRKTLYNLYHIINHFNLFGGGYQTQAMSMIDRLLGEVI